MLALTAVPLPAELAQVVASTNAAAAVHESAAFSAEVERCVLSANRGWLNKSGNFLEVSAIRIDGAVAHVHNYAGADPSYPLLHNQVDNLETKAPTASGISHILKIK